MAIEIAKAKRAVNPESNPGDPAYFKIRDLVYRISGIYYPEEKPYCETGRMLCEHWGLPKDLVDVVGCHHDVGLLPAAGPLACLVHLSDLLCRVRYLGHGHEEIMGVDLGSDAAWQSLVRTYPALGTMHLARFTLDIDGAMDQIVATVNSVFGAKRIAAPAAT